LIQGKISNDTPDFICYLCPQEYKSQCRAYLMPHTEQELQQRREMPEALCKLIQRRELSYPYQFMAYEKMHVYWSVFHTPRIEFSTGNKTIVIIFGIKRDTYPPTYVITHGRKYVKGSYNVPINAERCKELLGEYTKYILHKLKYSGPYVLKLPNLLEQL